MKKVNIILSFIMLIGFANAQQNAVAPAKKATPTMKVDSKASTINAPVTTNSVEPKACCAGKTVAQCSHDAKTCSKADADKPACCQKGGSSQSCNHGAAEKGAEK